MIFLDCPAYPDQEGTVRCWLPAQVRRRFITSSTDGPRPTASADRWLGRDWG